MRYSILNMNEVASGYAVNDDVYVPAPKEGEAWATAFRGRVMAAMPGEGKVVVTQDGLKGWAIPCSRLRRPSFAVTGQDSADVTRLDDYPVDDRVEFMARLTDMIVRHVSPSLIIAGDPGIGKTFTVRERFEKAGMKLDDSWCLVKGQVSAYGLYRLLYRQRDRIIVFDDSDSVFDNSNSVNLLKAALDSYDERVISWQTAQAERDGLPNAFLFRGAAIFISNLDLSRIDSAVSSRSLRMNFTMNNAEVLDRLGRIYPVMEPSVPRDLKDEVYRHLCRIGDTLSRISFRTMINAIRLRRTQPDRWQEMIPLFA